MMLTLQKIHTSGELAIAADLFVQRVSETWEIDPAVPQKWFEHDVSHPDSAVFGLSEDTRLIGVSVLSPLKHVLSLSSLKERKLVSKTFEDMGIGIDEVAHWGDHALLSEYCERNASRILYAAVYKEAQQCSYTAIAGQTARTNNQMLRGLALAQRMGMQELLPEGSCFFSADVHKYELVWFWRSLNEG